MLIRTRFVIRDVHCLRGDLITLTTPRDPHATITISYGPHPRKPENVVMMIEARGEVHPPEDSIPGILELSRAQPESFLGPGHEPVPDATLALCHDLVRPFQALCRETFRLVRWRLNVDSPHSPLSSMGSDFSLDDGYTWHPMPFRGHVFVSETLGLRLTDTSESLVQELVSRGAAEPVAHELLREARDVSRSNPRSAIVIAVAALESGFKRLLTRLVPMAEWLAMNTASPPVVKMLSQYLPLLTPPLTFDGRVVAPPKAARTILNNGVEARNAVVHRGELRLSSRQVDELLSTVADVLYLLDYYGGEAWALDNISDDFRAALYDGLEAPESAPGSASED